jgi:hypothetical protein
MFNALVAAASTDPDYRETTGVLNFAPGDQTESVTVPVFGDTLPEPDETLELTLTQPSGATITDGVGLGTISNDDGEPVDFDWTMPDRFGFDKDGDGLTDYYPPSGNLEIEPAGWRVDFTQTTPATCDTSRSRQWSIDGHLVLVSDPRVVSYDPHSCLFSYKFDEEGVYDVELRVEDAAGNQVGTLTKQVTVQDWLIVAIGDSVTSGEGVPDLTRAQNGGTARWQSEKCHRSAKAGPALAARRIENDDPRTSVTFVHLACSGAEIKKGLLQQYQGIVPGTLEPLPRPQVKEIRQRIPYREIDAILLSIGANDIDFSKIVYICIANPNCHLNMAAVWAGSLLLALPGKYADLNAALTSYVPGLEPGRVYITEYHDPTSFDSFTYCGENGTSQVLGDVTGSTVFGISGAEAKWASESMLGSLNQKVQATTAYGWKYVTPIQILFREHGYCSTDKWIVTYTQSNTEQGDNKGALHPNLAGHSVFGNKFREYLRADFYIGGNLSKPRPPA